MSISTSMKNVFAQAKNTVEEHVRTYTDPVAPVMLKDKSGNINVEMVIEIAIGLFIAAILLPIALTQIFGANTTSWDSTTKTLFTILGVAGLLGIVIALIKGAKA
jgi:hypothetical protein